MLTTFSLVALAEFGDITQILIANLSARFRDTWAVFIGASAAFLVVSGVGVLGGRAIIRLVPLSVVRRLSGLALLGLGIYTVVGLL
jgi:putative Ca2+/H+ antiporter (TMEM165/GDT1 family)